MDTNSPKGSTSKEYSRASSATINDMGADIKTMQPSQPVVGEKVSSQNTGIGSKIAAFFAIPQDAPPIEDKEVISKSYAHWRLRIFYSVFIAYVVFYICRKNISVALPALSSDLGYNNTQIGLLGSTLYFTYAFGKFINGILADRANVRTFLSTALIASAVANLCLVLSSMFITPGQFTFFGLPSATVLLWVMAFFWGCNGWFQSMGFPPIAKSLSYWYSNKERGTKWALWSTSHQTGTFLAVILCGFIVSNMGWRAAFIVPSMLSLGVSIFLFNRLRDKPTSIGLPDVEEFREPDAVALAKENSVDDSNDSYFDIFKKHILFNSTLWMLALAYIFVYIIRYGTEDWVIKYLMEVKKDSVQVAAMKLSFLPLFGIIGTISAGYFSDKVFKGKRAPINILFLVGVIGSIMLLKFNTSSTTFLDAMFLSVTGSPITKFVPLNGNGILDFIYLGMIGMFTYGPQVLVGGICAVESSSKKVASAATGFTGSFGYIGAMLSGVGTGMILDKFSWNGALYFWMASAFLCILILLPLWNKGGASK